jgi:ABC-2 type transport system permease protein
MTSINPAYREILIPSMVVFAIMVSTVLGLPGPLVELRDAGVFRSYKINGVPALSILSIPAVSTTFHALIVSLVVCLSAGPLFDGRQPVSWLNFTLIALVSAFTFGSLGMLIGVISKGSRSTVLWSQLIFLPSMMIGGLMMPLAALPESVRMFSGLLPSTYAMQALLGLAYGQETTLDPTISLIVLAAAGLMAAFLANYLFSWDDKNSTRRGKPWMAILVLVPFIAGIFLA